MQQSLAELLEMQEAGSVLAFERVDTCHSLEIERQSLRALPLEYLVQGLLERSLENLQERLFQQLGDAKE